jgi:hypothetical protein
MVDSRVIDECGTDGDIIIGRVNHSTWRKPVLISLEIEPWSLQWEASD